MPILDAIYSHNNDLLLKIIEDAKKDPVLHKKLSQKSNNNNSSTLLHLSISVNNYGALKILLDNQIGGDVVSEDAVGRMPLHLAIEKDSYECVNILCMYIVEKKPKWLSLILQKRDKKNNLPVFFACRYPKILNLLIKAVKETLNDESSNIVKIGSILGVSEKQASSNGLTPLHIASMCGMKESCELLLSISNEKQNKLINNLNNNNETALMVACKEGHADVVKYLCDETTDKYILDAQNKDGDTALHLCFMMGHEALGHYLIDKGCKETVKNNENKVPYDYQEQLDIICKNTLDESLVSIVRNLPIADLNLNNRKTSQYVVLDDDKLSAKAYLEKFILPDLQASLVALLKWREKIAAAKTENKYEPVEIDPCHWVASYLLRHKKKNKDNGTTSVPT